METVKVCVDGEKMDLVIKLDPEEILEDAVIKDDDKTLEDTKDLTEALSKTVELYNESNWWNG